MRANRHDGSLLGVGHHREHRRGSGEKVPIEILLVRSFCRSYLLLAVSLYMYFVQKYPRCLVNRGRLK